MINQNALEMNPFTIDLNRQFNELETTHADYLVIAHPDEFMIQKIKACFMNQSMVLTTIPQVAWDFGKQDFIDWEGLQLSFNTIILVGSSQGGNPQPCVEACGTAVGRAWDPNPRTASSSSINPFFERAQKANSRVKECEEHFVQQLDNISQSPKVEKLVLRNSTVLEGLFYRAESGLFCRFDRSERVFQPLMGEMA